MAYIAAMTDFDPNVAGWHLTYEQPTGACYVITVGLPDIDAARALAEQHEHFIAGDILVGRDSVSLDGLARYGVQPGRVVLTGP